MAVHLIFQCTLAELIEAVKFKRNPAAIREQQTVEADGQALLILRRDARRRTDYTRSTRH